MENWADYCISAVRYDGGRRHIDKVRVHACDGGGIGAAYECPRSEVVAAMGVWKSFVTILEEADENWVKCEDVRISEVGGRKYLRTDGSSFEFDDLGSLPEF